MENLKSKAVKKEIAIMQQNQFKTKTKKETNVNLLVLVYFIVLTIFSILVTSI